MLDNLSHSDVNPQRPRPLHNDMQHAADDNRLPAGITSGGTIFRDVLDTLTPFIDPGRPGLISDIYFNTDSPIYINWRREWVPLSALTGTHANKLTREEMSEIVDYCVYNNTERHNLIKDMEMSARSVDDFAIDWPRPSVSTTISSLTSPFSWRLRAHIGHSNRGRSLCVRVLPRTPPSFNMLGFPHSVVELATRPSGLMLVCGATGGGKSTTIAALVECYCQNNRGHVATLEDPIEYVLDSGVFAERLITQQWVGIHTPDWSRGIMDALRDRVNLIVIGEIRELPELRAAVKAAISGHLVIASTHDSSAMRVLSYLVSLYPPDEQKQARHLLALCLIGVLCQNLLASSIDERPVIPCYELLLNCPEIRTALLHDDFNVLNDAMRHNAGCTTWNSCLSELFKRSMISQEIYDRNYRDE